VLELEPLYIDVMIRRWHEFTGQTATRASDRMSFDEAATQAGINLSN